MRIGISACFFHADPQRAVFKGKTLLYLEQSLAHWVLLKGALAYMIPDLAENSSLSVKDFVNDLDALVLQGGSDVSPKSYGEAPLKPEWNGDFVRDNYEIALVKEFVAQEKPILGVCRGMQLLNVAFGGTLYQDITTQVSGSLTHRDWNIYDKNFHQITFEKDSQLCEIFPAQSTGKVNTVHHQGIKDLGKNLVVEARSSDDKIIEAFRGNGKSYVYAVQWHPEFQDPSDTSLLNTKPILDHFFKAIEKRKK